MRTAKAFALVITVATAASAQEMNPAAPAPVAQPEAPPPVPPAPAPAPAPAPEPAPAPPPVAAAPVAAAPSEDPMPQGSEPPWSPRRSRLALSADRLMGVFFWKQVITQPAGGGEVEPSGTQLNFLMGNSATGGGSSGASGGVQAPNPAAIPRAGLDVILGNGLTLGGSLGYIATSGETKRPQDDASVTVESASTNGYILAPRLGFLIETGPVVSIWLRGGLTVYSYSIETPDFETSPRQEISAQGTQVTLEPALVVTPIDHFGFSASIAIDQAMTGNWKYTTEGVSNSENFRATSYGVAVGLVGFF